MAAAKVMDPELKQYLKENRLPDVYEVLFYYEMDSGSVSVM